MDVQSIELILRHNTAGKLPLSFIIDPHSVNFDDGYILYNHEVDYSDLVSLLKALKSEVSIKRVECRGLKYPNLQDLFVLFEILSINNSVITVDISPHLINTQTGLFCFSPTNSPQITTEQVSSLRSFLECFNIKKLTIKGCSFTSEASDCLYDLIRVNNTLTSIDFTGLSIINFSKIVNALEHNFSLEKASLQLNLPALLTIFKLVSTAKLRPIVQIDPHLIDFENGLIVYENEVTNTDLLVFFQLFKNTEIKRVECFLLGNLSLKGRIALWNILASSKSVIAIDISPHFIAIDNGIFCLSPRSSTQMSTSEVSLLQSFFKSFSKKELDVQWCDFSDKAIINLHDFLRKKGSLTSVDFSNCELSDSNLWRILDSLELNSSSILSKVNFEHNSITGKGALTIEAALQLNENVIEINLENNSIDS
ncbi:hypothetical protein GEMRC1_012116 [Eukaryota sp. GEM-RC1]